MRILNVAEKPSVARALAELLSGGLASSSAGENKYCKIHRFEYSVEGVPAEMVFTSVLGHLYSIRFKEETKWHEIDPRQLFSDPVEFYIGEEMASVSRNLLSASRGCSLLIIWTDCDREGENIGEQIANLLQPNIQQVKRARFSGLGSYEIKRAVENLCQLNLAESQAVSSRFEIDLRIGAALTRLQTLSLQNFFQVRKVISYGSCQIPTLGFVCEREEMIANFIEEDKWTIEVAAQPPAGQPRQRTTASPRGGKCRFGWARGYIFEREYVVLKQQHIQGHPLEVTRSEKKPVLKYKPVPLRTVELQKFFARKKGAVGNSHELMKIAESLYTSGYISYPRTETDAFPSNFNYQEPINRLKRDPVLGGYASQLVPERPSAGKHSDQAHTPIYPMKDGGSLAGKDRAVYEYIARRFLACYSKHAEGVEELVECTVNGEVFTRKSLEVIRRNYLEVFVYDQWGDDQPSLEVAVGTVLEWSSAIKEGHTEQPGLLTEAELIAKMDANGIGTDATIHDHIQRIKEREYVRTHNGNQLECTWIGRSLITGYREVGLTVHEPYLRKEFEVSLKKIERQEVVAGQVVGEQLALYRAIYATIEEGLEKFKAVFSRLQEADPDPGVGGPPAGRTNKTGVASKPNYPKRKCNEPPATSTGGFIQCNCQIEAKEQRVRKEGKNQGKQFYTCPAQQCDFFQWKEGPPPLPKPLPTTRSAPHHSAPQPARAAPQKEGPRCHCNRPSKRLVAKTAANNNRVFFRCGQTSSPCQFFEWG